MGKNGDGDGDGEEQEVEGGEIQEQGRGHKADYEKDVGGRGGGKGER